MRTWKQARHICLLALIAAAALFFLWPSREPSYDGKKLSYWLEELHDWRGEFDDRIPHPAADAIREIGTNAIPTLLRLIQSKDSGLRKVIAEIAERSVFDLGFDSAFRKQARAVNGFAALGPIAAPAVPSLTTLLRSADGRAVKGAAAEALACIGPESVPALIQALSDTNKWTRFFAAFEIQKVRPTAKSCVPDLVTRLKDEERDVRLAATISLGEMAQEPETVVPALIESLSATNDVELWAAIRALGRFKGDAKAAVPSLKQILQANTSDRALTALVAHTIKSLEDSPRQGE